MANLQKQLDAAEKRLWRSEKAYAALNDHATAVGVAVPSSGPEPTLVFFCLEGSAWLSMYALDEATRLEGDGDASELLSGLYRHLMESVVDSAVVAGRLPRSDSALLADPSTRTVSIYRPKESANPKGSWTFEEGANDQYAIGDVMQPGYRAVVEEQEAADDQRESIVMEIKGISRPALQLAT
jgi:hypothetical protein